MFEPVDQRNSFFVSSSAYARTKNSITHSITLKIRILMFTLNIIF